MGHCTRIRGDYKHDRTNRDEQREREREVRIEEPQEQTGKAPVGCRRPIVLLVGGRVCLLVNLRGEKNLGEPLDAATKSARSVFSSLSVQHVAEDHEKNPLASARVLLSSSVAGNRMRLLVCGFLEKPRQEKKKWVHGLISTRFRGGEEDFNPYLASYCSTRLQRYVNASISGLLFRQISSDFFLLFCFLVLVPRARVIIIALGQNGRRWCSTVGKFRELIIHKDSKCFVQYFSKIVILCYALSLKFTFP